MAVGGGHDLVGTRLGFADRDVGARDGLPQRVAGVLVVLCRLGPQFCRQFFGSGQLLLGCRELGLGRGPGLGRGLGDVRCLGQCGGADGLGTRLGCGDRGGGDAIWFDSRGDGGVCELLLGLGEDLGRLAFGSGQMGGRLCCGDGGVQVACALVGDCAHIVVGCCRLLEQTQSLGLCVVHDPASALLRLTLDLVGALARSSQNPILAGEERCHRRLVGELLLGRGYRGELCPQLLDLGVGLRSAKVPGLDGLVEPCHQLGDVTIHLLLVVAAASGHKRPGVWIGMDGEHTHGSRIGRISLHLKRDFAR